MRAGADVGAAAVVAADEAGEQVVGRVATAKGGIFVAAAEDLLGFLESVVVDERVVQAGIRFAVPADEAAVRGVGEDQLQRVRRPALLARRRCGFRFERAGDGGRPELPVRVEVEDTPHYRRLHFIWHEQLGLFVAGVAVGGAAAHPFAFADAAFEAGGDAVDDRGVFELGEHAEHLQHHPPRRRAGIERLGRRLQDDVELVEFLTEPGELTHLAGEAVDAVDQEQVDAFLARELERLLQAGPVEACAGGLVFVGGDDPPVLHRLAVALQPFPLGLRRGGLVILVG
jgi:hypothetical protein